MSLTDEEKQNWDRAMSKANAALDLHSGDPEQSFKASFIAAGNSPELAAQKAKIAKQGRGGSSL